MKRIAIIGGGISGLSAAYFLRKKRPDIEIDLYETQSRLGGVIRTEKIEGCIFEAGPDSFLTQKKAASLLCAELGIGTELVGSNDADRKTYLVHQGRLKPLPDGFFLMVPTRLLPLLSTDLLSWNGKFSAMADLFEPPQEKDCSVADFIERRFGKEILQQIAEPLLSGVYGASVDRLSLQSALPQIWELQKKGSMVWSLLKKSGASTESLFTTLANGMESLIEALQKRSPGVRFLTSTPVPSIEKKNGKWSIRENEYDGLLLAAGSVPEIRTNNGLRIREILQTIRRNSAVVIVMGFEKTRRQGFGWLVPSAERHSVLAGTYVSNKFPDRSPRHLFLVRLFIGGDQAAEWIDRQEDEIRREVLSELQRIAGISEIPLFDRIYKWKNAMPEYAVGHADKIAELRLLAQQEKNLFLAGNIFAGVGVPDCIKQAEISANEIAGIGL